MYILNYKDDSWTSKISLKFRTKKDAIKDVSRGCTLTSQLQELNRTNFLRLEGITIWITKATNETIKE